MLDLNFGNSLQLNQTTSGSLADGREDKFIVLQAKLEKLLVLIFFLVRLLRLLNFMRLEIMKL
ncbi:MAG: hypothetical protein HC930_14770 [Hydrococcus sp. SU_1_0]|nr:hypothetical protein [Hydrococcus sp. SU_1_0]